MDYQMPVSATLLATNNFHIGPWIIVPIIFLIAIIGTPIYVIRDRRKRRSNQQTQRTARRE